MQRGQKPRFRLSKGNTVTPVPMLSGLMLADHQPLDHSHRRARSYGHDHTHAPASYDRAFAIGVGLNLGFVVAVAARASMAMVERLVIGRHQS